MRPNRAAATVPAGQEQAGCRRILAIHGLEVMTRAVIDPAREARVIAAVGSSAIRSGCAWPRVGAGDDRPIRDPSGRVK